MSERDKEVPAEQFFGMVVHRVMDPGMPADEVFLLSGGKLMEEQWEASIVNGYMEIKVIKRIVMPQMVKIKFNLVTGADDDG